MTSITKVPQSYKNGTLRIHRLSYGNGCREHDNCFNCPIPVERCPFNCRTGDSLRTVYIDAAEIFDEKPMES